MYLVLVSKSKFKYKIISGAYGLNSTVWSTSDKVWAVFERSIQPTLRSVPAPQLPAPRSAHAQSFSVTSAHRSVPAQPIFGPLRSVFRSAHAPLTCSALDELNVQILFLA